MVFSRVSRHKDGVYMVGLDIDREGIEHPMLVWVNNDLTQATYWPFETSLYNTTVGRGDERRHCDAR